jgi:hypothetical protein
MLCNYKSGIMLTLYIRGKMVISHLTPQLIEGPRKEPKIIFNPDRKIQLKKTRKKSVILLGSRKEFLLAVKSGSAS